MLIFEVCVIESRLVNLILFTITAEIFDFMRKYSRAFSVKLYYSQQLQRPHGTLRTILQRIGLVQRLPDFTVEGTDSRWMSGSSAYYGRSETTWHERIMHIVGMYRIIFRPYNCYKAYNEVEQNALMNDAWVFFFRKMLRCIVWLGECLLSYWKGYRMWPKKVLLDVFAAFFWFRKIGFPFINVANPWLRILIVFGTIFRFGTKSSLQNFQF